MKKTIMFMLFATLLIFTACGEEAVVQSGTGYVGGNKGVEIKFLDNVPPKTVASNMEEEFDVIVELTNRGEYEIMKEDVRVKISGFPPQSFSTTPAELVRNPVENIPAVYKAGDGTVVKAPGIPVEFLSLKYTGTEAVSLDFPFRAEVCYKYETNVATELCVKNDFNRDQDGDICKVSSPRKLSSSGAPIQILSVTQSPSGRDRTTFTFQVKNQDTGKVFTPSSSCEETTANRNKIFVKVSGLTNTELRCIGLTGGDSTSGYITLGSTVEESVKDISCTYTPVDKSARVQPFTITLAYDYSSSVDTVVQVQSTYE